VIHTRLCDLLGVDRPILNAPMGGGDAPGTEAGGHTGPMSTFPLLPAVVDAVLTEVFDIALGIPWPDGVAGRALYTGFVDEWHGREAELRDRVAGSGPVATAADYASATWAGEASGFVTTREPAGDVVRTLVAQAADVLARRPPEVIDP
jgi:NAD(P)H-dependent flavin oxidoreductase YrpB (nitropropane dioxygenase family)